MKVGYGFDGSAADAVGRGGGRKSDAIKCGQEGDLGLQGKTGEHLSGRMKNSLPKRPKRSEPKEGLTGGDHNSLGDPGGGV